MRVRKGIFLVVGSLGLLAFLSLSGLAIWWQPSTFRGHAGAVNQVEISPDGKTLASVSRDDKTIRIWDVVTRKQQVVLHGNTEHVSVAFSPDGKILASRGDETIKLWDMTTGKERATLKGHTDLVTSMTFSPDGKTVASGSWDKTVKLWDLATESERTTLNGHVNRVRSLAFSPDGKTIAWGGDETTIKLWDVASGKERATFSGASQYDYVRWLAFSPDGKTLASATFSAPRVTLWDVTTGKGRILEFPKWVDARDEPIIGFIAFSPDGKTLVSVIDGAIGLWDVVTGKNTAVCVQDHRPFPISICHTLDRLGVSLTPERDYASSVLFTPDGKLTALGMNAKTVLLWKVAAVPIRRG